MTVGHGWWSPALYKQGGHAGILHRMARPLLIEMEGGLYHVTVRGWQRRSIVDSDRDRQDWIRLRMCCGNLTPGCHEPAVFVTRQCPVNIVQRAYPEATNRVTQK